MTESRGISVAPVRSPHDWRDFHRLRWTVYENDPAAVMPLAREERLLLDVDRHPFWQHAEREVFLARRSGKVVGRIAAIVDQQHQEYHSDRTGFFGFFECENEPETAKALIKVAAEWLHTRNCDLMRGPASPSMKGEFGVVVDGHNVPPMVMMAHTPAWYETLLCACGLSRIHDFLAFSLDRAGVVARRDRWQNLSAVCQRLLQRNPELEVRTGTRADIDDTLREVNRLANRVRTPVWGFVPITDAEIEFLIGRLKQIVKPDLMVTVRRNGAIVGYTLCLPDVNWALAHTFGRSDLVRLLQMPFLLRRIPRVRMFALGADPQFRTAGIVSLLFYKTIEAALHRFDEFEFSWISEDNLPSLKVVQHILPMQASRRYRLFQAPLPMN